MSGGGEILPLVMTKSPKEGASSGIFARTTSCITDPQVRVDIEWAMKLSENLKVQKLMWKKTYTSQSSRVIN